MRSLWDWMRARWVGCLAVVAGLWLLVIGVLTLTPFFGTPSTNLMYDWAMERFPGVSSATVLETEMLLRKIVHVVIYAVLTVFLLAVLTRVEFRWTPLNRDAGLGASVVLLVAFVGAVDEGVQVLLPDRHGAVRDVLVDAAGAGLVVSLWGGFRWWRRRRHDSIHVAEEGSPEAGVALEGPPAEKREGPLGDEAGHGETRVGEDDGDGDGGETQDSRGTTDLP